MIPLDLTEKIVDEMSKEDKKASAAASAASTVERASSEVIYSTINSG